MKFVYNKEIPVNHEVYDKDVVVVVARFYSFDFNSFLIAKPRPELPPISVCRGWVHLAGYLNTKKAISVCITSMISFKKKKTRIK